MSSVEASSWLQILIIIKQGVLVEFVNRYDQLIEPLLLIVRFDDQKLRSIIFSKFVETIPPMDLPFFRQLAINMIDNVRVNKETQSSLSDQVIQGTIIYIL